MKDGSPLGALHLYILINHTAFRWRRQKWENDAKKCLYWISCFSARGKSTCFSGNNALCFVRRPLDKTKNSSAWIQRPLNKDAVGMQSVARKGRLRGRQRENRPALRVRWSEGEEPILTPPGGAEEEELALLESRSCNSSKLCASIHPSALLEAGLSRGHAPRDRHDIRAHSLSHPQSVERGRQELQLSIILFRFHLTIRHLVCFQLRRQPLKSAAVKQRKKKEKKKGPSWHRSCALQ